MWRSDEGSAVVESVFAILFLMTLVLGTVQVVLTLYARNVVRAAAHEGVRSAIDHGASGVAAEEAAHRAITRAAGRLLGDVEVDVVRSSADGPAGLTAVRITARLRSVGPVPVMVPVTAIAHAVTPAEPR